MCTQLIVSMPIHTGLFIVEGGGGGGVIVKVTICVTCEGYLN